MTKLWVFSTMVVLLMVLAACQREDASTTLLPPEPDIQEPTPSPSVGDVTEPDTSTTLLPPEPDIQEPTPSPSVGDVTVQDVAPDSFVAVVPRTLRSGYTERVSVSLFNRDRAAVGNVRLTLLDAGAPVRTVAARVAGSANLELPVPRLEQGTYEIEVAVEEVRQTSRASVDVEDGVLLFVETDKPIYKPGQTVHVRLMTLDALLKPCRPPRP